MSIYIYILVIQRTNEKTWAMSKTQCEWEILEKQYKKADTQTNIIDTVRIVQKRQIVEVSESDASHHGRIAAVDVVQNVHQSYRPARV